MHACATAALRPSIAQKHGENLYRNRGRARGRRAGFENTNHRILPPPLTKLYVTFLRAFSLRVFFLSSSVETDKTKTKKVDVAHRARLIGFERGGKGAPRGGHGHWPCLRHLVKCPLTPTPGPSECVRSRGLDVVGGEGERNHAQRE